jgi:hypothetical protein
MSAMVSSFSHSFYGEVLKDGALLGGWSFSRASIAAMNETSRESQEGASQEQARSESSID